MIKSSKARKQRRFRFNAPLHERQKFVNAHISKELSAKLGIKKRSIEIRKGDTVKVRSGDQKGKSGKVIKVDLRKSKVSIDGLNVKNAKGKESNILINVSNLYITDLDLSDKLRKEKIERFKSK